MNREETKKKALENSKLRSDNSEERYYTPDYARTYDACIQIAEWMDEQYKHLCVMETSNTQNVADNDLIWDQFLIERNRIIKEIDEKDKIISDIKKKLREHYLQEHENAMKFKNKKGYEQLYKESSLKATIYQQVKNWIDDLDKTISL